MLHAASISKPLADEFDLRARRARAVAAVTARLEAERTEAAAGSAAAATVVAALRDRFSQLCELRDRLEAEHAAALMPTSEIVGAEKALASATARVRGVPVDDDAAATTAANALAEIEDQLTSAQQAQARKVRPLALRLSIAIEQTGDAERELKAAQDAVDAADKRVRNTLVKVLRMRRDAALLAFDAANVDLALAGGDRYLGGCQATFGESDDLVSELGGKFDHYFGSSWSHRSQQIGRADPALLLQQAGPHGG